LTLQQARNAGEKLYLDDCIRGVPPGTDAFDADEIAERKWRPIDGRMALPVLTLDEAAFANNRALMLRYISEQGVAIAPHAKTPMAPALALALIEGGAWGATVADIRQAGVMLRAGVSRLILANEVGGIGGARRLATLLAKWPNAEFAVFVDSRAAVDALAAVWRADGALAPLRVLVELGAGRAGARTYEAAAEIVAAISEAGGRLALAGVAAYEGAAAQPTPQATQTAIAGLLALTGDVLRLVRAQVGRETPLILTAGGSVFFDRVIAALAPLAKADGATTLILRSGAIFFHDHGVYERGLATLDSRGGFSLGGAAVSAGSSFRPALRLWAEVLSRPEPNLAILGLGMRDASFDQGLPVPLRAYRNGEALAAATEGSKVVKLNDQHAFLELDPANDLIVGDVVEFGVSHPCTCLDRYRVIFTLEENGFVHRALPTYFG
jgi:D-serine dehydratase